MATTDLSNIDLSNIPSMRGKNIYLVVSQWNKEITDGLKNGAIETLGKLGMFTRTINVVEVPGSFELPYAAKQIQDTKDPDAIICIGCVIKGETSHFDYVCQGTTYGIQKLNLNGKCPVVFCVLTDNTIAQSKARSGGKHGNKGVEAAVTAAKMIEFKESLS